jgi:long-chain acyl-CoA synthetase
MEGREGGARKTAGTRVTGWMFPLCRIVDRALALHANERAVVQDDTRLSYAELLRRVAHLAGALAATGLRPGDRVAILGRNSFRYLEINLACACAGLVLVPLNTRLAEPEIHRILARTEARLLLRSLSLDPRGLATIAWSDDDPIGADNPYERLIAAGPPLERMVERKLDDVAQIFFTSGTTGEPKGACLNQQNLVASALGSIPALELSASDVWFHAPPMFHLVDAFAIWAITLVGGRHVIAHFEPAQFAAIVEAERITKTSLPPTLLDMIARSPQTAGRDLASLERISYGGSPMPAPVFARSSAALGCDLVQAYGVTEVSGIVCHQSRADLTAAAPARRTSVGRPALTVDLRVVDDKGNDLAEGEIGEMAVAGPQVMAGYWRDEAATSAAIPDGWYRSGDLGTRDADGYFRIVGRKKDMIITGGENVYPAEVESVLLGHPAVAEAAVIGMPSERWGEEVHAVVVFNAGMAASADALIAHCRGLIGGYKVPKAITAWTEPLPKSGPGKIAKAVVREKYLRS